MVESSEFPAIMMQDRRCRGNAPGGLYESR